MQAVFAALYRLALSLWIGGMVLFTFVMTPVIFRSQGRDAAGRIVSAMFPVYFRFCLVLAAAMLAVRALAGCAVPGARRIAGTAIIAAALCIHGYQAFRLAPRMDGIRRTVASFETVPKEDPARREFSRLHGISMGLNMAVIAGGVVLVLFEETFRK